MRSQTDHPRNRLHRLALVRRALQQLLVLALVGGVVTGCSDRTQGDALAAQGRVVALGSALQLSHKADRTHAYPLAGATVQGDLYIFVPNHKELVQVRFYLDDPEQLGSPYAIQNHAPFDLRGGSSKAARPWNTAQVAPANHTLTAVLRFRRGNRAWEEVAHAAFTVRRADALEPPAGADILWSADHSTGDLSQWYIDDGGGEFNSGGGTSGVSTAVARSGRHAAFLRLSNVKADQGVRLFRWRESRRHEELFYSAWFYFPQRYTAPNWWNIFQFKSKTETRNDAFFQLNVGNRAGGEMHLYLFNWMTRRAYPQALVDLPVGRWVQLEALYKSRGDATGQIIVWQDGVEIFNVKDVQTQYPDGDTQWSINNYTDRIQPDPAVTFVDDVVISRSRVGPGLHAAATVEGF